MQQPPCGSAPTCDPQQLALRASPRLPPSWRRAQPPSRPSRARMSRGFSSTMQPCRPSAATAHVAASAVSISPCVERTRPAARNESNTSVAASLRARMAHLALQLACWPSVASAAAACATRVRGGQPTHGRHELPRNHRVAMRDRQLEYVPGGQKMTVPSLSDLTTRVLETAGSRAPPPRGEPK